MLPRIFEHLYTHRNDIKQENPVLSPYLVDIMAFSCEKGDLGGKSGGVFVDKTMVRQGAVPSRIEGEGAKPNVL